MIISCNRSSDISGVYIGEITLDEDEKVELILNQIGKNISGSITIAESETIQIQSGIVEENNVTFIAVQKRLDKNLMEFVIEIKFEGNIKTRRLNGNVVVTVRRYEIVGDHIRGISTVPIVETLKGILTASR